MYHCSVGTHLGHKNYIYTKLCKCSQKIKDFKISSSEPLVVLDHWSNKIEEYFHLVNPDNNNLSEKYTTQDVKNVISSMVNHVNSMEQGIIVLQDKFIESKNERLKQSVRIDQFIQENISTQKSLHQLLYVIKNVHARVPTGV